MNAKTIVYWTATTVIGLETLAGGATDLMHGREVIVSGRFVVDVISHLGYPAYLLIILGLWKLLGGVVLFVPGLPRLKEWAYAGIVFELTGAAASWALHGDAASELISPIVLALVALTSWALRPPTRLLGTILESRIR